MKKILSTILTLTMLSLPLAVQCSANQCSYDNYGNCYVEIPVSNENNDIAPKEEKGFLSKVGSFCLKTLLFATVAIGATVALCKWAPNGEAGAAARDFYDNTLVPGAKSSYNYLKGKAAEYWNSTKQNANNLYADTLKPWAQTFFNTTIPDTFSYATNWASNICVEKNTPCDPNHYGSDCNTTNIGDCKKTVGQLVTEGKDWASEKWNKLNNLCIYGQDGNCQTAVKDVFGKVVTTVKNNVDAFSAKLPPIDFSNCKDVTLSEYFNATNCSEAPQTFICYCSNKQSN